MKYKNLIFYVIYTALILLYFIFGSYLSNILRLKANSTGNPNVYINTSYLLSFIFGCLLGLPFLLSQLKKHGKWKIDNTKFLLQFLPFLILTIWKYIPELYFSFNPGSSLSNRLILFAYDLFSRFGFLSLFLMVFMGYSLITSFVTSEKIEN